MSSFAERMGAVSPRTVLQTDALDKTTRVDIWNVLHLVRGKYNGLYGGDDAGVLKRLWSGHWASPLDEFRFHDAVAALRQAVMEGDYIDCLGAVESYVKAVSSENMNPNAATLTSALNEMYKRDLVGYRFVGLELVPVTEEEEVAAIEGALTDLGKYSGARTHLANAVRFLSDRSNPQYAKSVAESISAVEAIVRMMTGQKTLGKGLTKLKDRGFVIHGALESSWSILYGYTSDENGVRHGSIDASDVDEKLATYMLVTCSAFVSLLLKVEAESHGS